MSTVKRRVEHRKRMREARKAHRAAGGTTLSVPVDAETSRMIEELLWGMPRVKKPKNKRELVAWAVKCLHEKLKENGRKESC